MLLLGLGVLFGGESGLWKALVRTIFLDFGQKSGRSAGGMSFDEAGCLNRNSKRAAWRSAEAGKEMGQKMHCAAMADAACCDDLRSVLRSQVQRSPLSSFVFFQSQCGTFPVLLFPFLQQNKPFFPSLFTFEAGIRQANTPGACPVLSCFVQRARIIRTCVLQLITCVQRIKPHFVFSFFENLLYLCRNLIFS